MTSLANAIAGVVAGTATSPARKGAQSSSTGSTQQSRSPLQSHILASAHPDDDEDGDDEDGDLDGDEEEDEGEGVQQAHGLAGNDMLHEHTVKSGYLWKKGEKRKTWKKRWFVLRASKLAYYKNDKEYQLLRLIDMSEVHTVASVEFKKNKHAFGIVTPKRTYYVKASSKSDMSDWIERLNEVKTQIAQSSTLTQGSPMVMSPMGDEPDDSSMPSPAQPRAIPASPVASSSRALSPLSATTGASDSESSEAQRFGLSYASSFGQSLMGSSPGKATRPGHQSGADRLSSGGYSPANSHSGGEISDQRRQHSESLSRREQSVGSSGGERLNVPSSDAQGGAGLSSSEEEDWDEDEGADQAMPLPALTPGGLNFAPNNADFAEQIRQHQQQQQLPQPAKQEGNTSDFLRDPSRIILQGYLMKQSNRRKHWRKRWFVLTSSKLMYTRSHMDAKAHRQIPVASILDAIEYQSKKAQKDTSSPPLSPSSVAKTFNFGSFGEAAESVDGAGDESNGALVSGHVESIGGQQAPPIERRNSVLAAASGVASSVGAGVGVGIQKKKKENCFRIITPKRNFLICAPSEEEEIKWLSTLQTLISRVREANSDKPAPASAKPSAPISQQGFHISPPTSTIVAAPHPKRSRSLSATSAGSQQM